MSKDVTQRVRDALKTLERAVEADDAAGEAINGANMAAEALAVLVSEMLAEQDRESDPRIPGVKAATEWFSHVVSTYPPNDMGKEMFHILKEMEYWLMTITEGEGDG